MEVVEENTLRAVLAKAIKEDNVKISNSIVRGVLIINGIIKFDMQKGRYCFTCKTIKEVVKKNLESTKSRTKKCEVRPSKESPDKSGIIEFEVGNKKKSVLLRFLHWRLFYLLHQNINSVVSYSNLMEDLDIASTESLRSNISRLSAFLKDNKVPYIIENVRNEGYIIKVI